MDEVNQLKQSSIYEVREIKRNNGDIEYYFGPDESPSSIVLNKDGTKIRELRHEDKYSQVFEWYPDGKKHKQETVLCLGENDTQFNVDKYYEWYSNGKPKFELNFAHFDYDDIPYNNDMVDDPEEILDTLEGTQFYWNEQDKLIKETVPKYTDKLDWMDKQIYKTTK